MTRKGMWLLTLVALAAVVPYLPAVTYEFVHDDHPQIADNPHLRMWPGFGHVFSTNVWRTTGFAGDTNYYRPLMFVTYNAVFTIVGAAPWAFHLVNILFHGAVAAAVFLLSLQIWKREDVAAIAGLLFALHPIHSEPVVWIAAICDLGCTLFFLLALYFYLLEYEPAYHATVAYVLCYAVALLWKETAIMFLPIVILYDWFVSSQFRIKRYVLLGAVTVAYLALRVFALGGIAPVVVRSAATFSPVEQILTALHTLGVYLEKLLVPHNLTLFYPIWFTVSEINLRVVAVVAVLAAALWKLRGRTGLAAIWVIAAMIPVLIATKVSTPISERNTYLASVGFVWLAAIGISHLKSRARVLVTAGIAAAYLVLLAARLPDWQDDLPLLQSALRVAPSNYARLLLTDELHRLGRTDEALVHVEEALMNDPNDVHAMLAKANIAVAKQNWDVAASTCRNALVVSRNAAVAHCHVVLGVVARENRIVPEALKHFDQALEINPGLWQALFHQGEIAMESGEYAVAAKKFEEVLKRQLSPSALNNLGNAYARLGQIDRAVAAYTDALRIDPSMDAARRNLQLVTRARR